MGLSGPLIIILIYIAFFPVFRGIGTRDDQRTSVTSCVAGPESWRQEGAVIPRCSMYGMVYLLTYIWVIFRVNVGKYSIHGAYGIQWKPDLSG